MKQVPLSVTVDGITYVLGTDSQLTASGSNWTLNLSAKSPAFTHGTYNVTATSTDAAGNAVTDTTTGELQIDTVAPVVGVTAQTTNDTTPTLSGPVSDADSSISSVSVTLNGITYTASSSGPLTYDPISRTWSLDVSSIGALAEGTYEIVAVAVDAAGNTGRDTTASELVIDTTAPTVTVNRLVTSDQTPIITGTLDDSAATLTVVVNGMSYNDSSSQLTINGDGTWTLDLSDGANIPEGFYDVFATAVDTALNQGTDGTSNELVIDITAPAVTVTNQVTGNLSPTIAGTISERVATLRVTVDGQTYTTGTGSPLVIANGGAGPGWTLDLAAAGQRLSPATYTVTASATDFAGNNGLATGTLIIDNAPPDIDGQGGLRMRIRGRVSANAIRVEVQGQVIRPATDGTYEAVIRVPYVPIEVPVEVFDSAGNSISGSLRVGATRSGDG